MNYFVSNLFEQYLMVLMLVVAQAARQDLPRRGTFQVTWDGGISEHVPGGVRDIERICERVA